MILRPPSTTPLPTDPRLRAGVQAERQMAHYLHRALATSADRYVINDLRLMDPQLPEQDGTPGLAQVDHLVLHRYGAFIVESKSLTGKPHFVSSTPQPPMPNAPPVPSEPAGATPPCPRCGSAMVRRVARQGPHAGGAFLGCSRYPACKATLRAPGEG